jgi:hypothetical protein
VNDASRREDGTATSDEHKQHSKEIIHERFLPLLNRSASGIVARHCKPRQVIRHQCVRSALSSFKQAAEKSSFGVEAWAWKASQQLSDFDHGSAKQKLQSILERVKKSDSSDSPGGWWFYNGGMLDASSGNTQQAAREFREALLLGMP